MSKSAINVNNYEGVGNGGGTRRGQLLIIDGTPCIIQDGDLYFDGHHISQKTDAPLWIRDAGTITRAGQISYELDSGNITSGIQRVVDKILGVINEAGAVAATAYSERVKKAILEDTNCDLVLLDGSCEVDGDRTVVFTTNFHTQPGHGSVSIRVKVKVSTTDAGCSIILSAFSSTSHYWGVLFSGEIPVFASTFQSKILERIIDFQHNG